MSVLVKLVSAVLWYHSPIPVITLKIRSHLKYHLFKDASLPTLSDDVPLSPSTHMYITLLFFLHCCDLIWIYPLSFLIFCASSSILFKFHENKDHLCLTQNIEECLVLRRFSVVIYGMNEWMNLLLSDYTSTFPLVPGWLVQR